MYQLSYEEVYYNRNESKIRDARLEFVKYANKNGIKPAARRFNVRKNTIKKWVDRFNDQGIKGLRDQSKRPKNSPKQLNKSAIKEIRDVTLWAKHKKKVITAPNILTKVKNAQAHNVTTKCVNRYINETLNKAKRGRKKCFDGNVEWKEKLNVFRLVQIDLKHLDDIPSIKHIWSTHRGPKYQITMVDVGSGYKVVAYIPEKSVTYTSKFLHKYLMPILRKLDIDPGEVLVQTDSGAEFYNVHRKNDATRVPNAFETTLKALGVNHTTIPIRACTYNSDVESFNGVIERQCLGWYDFKSVENMMTKVHTYLENKNNSICGNRTISAVDKIKKETGHQLKSPVPRLIKL